MSNIANNIVKECEVQYLECPTVSENDPKLYKSFILKNGLRVLVVSDPTPEPYDDLTSSLSNGSTDSSDSSGYGDNDPESDAEDEEDDDINLAACALLVDVGSLSDPEKFPGLAHLLVQMILINSEKYPQEIDFDPHIRKYEGSMCANIDYEETTYYFEVAEKHLDSTMNYFSALLKAPFARDIEFVDSEFQQCLHNDADRRDQILASLSTERYPHCVLSSRNAKYLKEMTTDDELNEAVVEFREKHYSAHRMMLCVQARLPIDHLVHLAVMHFSDIPSNNLNGKDLHKFHYRDTFQPEFYDHVFFIKTIENMTSLELTWVWPPVKNSYKCKPNRLFAYFFGHKGEGSLYAYLRKRLWALDLNANVENDGFHNNSIYSLFRLCILLTPIGLQHLDDILAAIFSYAKLFVCDSSCINSLEKAFTELQNIEFNNFRFASEGQASDNVENLVLAIKQYPPKDILTGAHIYFEFDKAQIIELMAILNEFHLNITIISNAKYDDIAYDKTEKWFGTEYTSIKIPKRWHNLWDESKPMEELFLPKSNPFVANDFRIFWHENGRPKIPSVPERIMQTDVCELWFRQDDKFNLPESSMFFSFISPLLSQSVENATLCSLYTDLIQLRLNEELYPATFAKLSYEIHAKERGITVKINGFNEKQPLLVNAIIKAMVSLRDYITEDEFIASIESHKKGYFYELIKPKYQNKDVRLSTVKYRCWSMLDKYKSLNDLNLKKMLEFSEQFTKEMYIQALMQGNLTEETAHDVMNSVLATIDCQKIIERKYIENRIVQLPRGFRYIRCYAFNPEDANTNICNFYQFGPATIQTNNILKLLMMLMKGQLFDTLHTKKQLGYNFQASVQRICGITGYSITSNSQETGQFRADHVEERIEAFRASMLVLLFTMKPTKFDQLRNSLIENIQVKSMSLSEEVERNWVEIAHKEYVFDRRKHNVNFLCQLTKQDVIDFILNNERTNFRKLSIQVIGNKIGCKSCHSDSVDTEETNEELFSSLADKLELKFISKDDNATITDINEFKENLFVFPITKTLDDSPFDT